MDKLELIVFNVGHGLSVALIEYPNKYVTLIDLGADSGFTPLKYLKLQRKLYPDILYITHPHADHIYDIKTALDVNFKPASINFQDYDWEDVANKEKKEYKDIINAYVKGKGSIPFSSYKGEAKLNCWRYTPENAKKAFGETNYINNSSYFFIYTWQSFKLAIAGDQHKEALEGLINTDAFAAEAKDSYIFIVPHHGHASGFTRLWPTKIGKPYITIASVDELDPHVDPGYSNNYSKGIKISNEDKYLLTTRDKGNISVEMWHENERPNWSFKYF
ncbi:MAG: hypothetical protein WC500_06570 [Candidatus Margulisiibacteriota bacterium]